MPYESVSPSDDTTLNGFTEFCGMQVEKSTATAATRFANPRWVSGAVRTDGPYGTAIMWQVLWKPA